MFVWLGTLGMFPSFIQPRTHNTVTISINKSKHMCTPCSSIKHLSQLSQPKSLIYILFWDTHKIIVNCILKDLEDMEARGKYLFSLIMETICFYFVKNVTGRGMGWTGKKKQHQSGETVSKELKHWLLLPFHHKWQQ